MEAQRALFYRVAEDAVDPSGLASFALRNPFSRLVDRRPLPAKSLKLAARRAPNLAIYDPFAKETRCNSTMPPKTARNLPLKSLSLHQRRLYIFYSTMYTLPTPGSSLPLCMQPETVSLRSLANLVRFFSASLTYQGSTTFCCGN